ncbi:hypothetical protein CSKR_103214 [Clonorchis sinensis]|uniref:Uncharacterized protein n=1 Tax=Clonorchis sinensis TaxID=79923 RepID=A0A3R7G752_CLOSI|nr:hypothetical protein CSKR_103214 [Clonorchis sinensis]
MDDYSLGKIHLFAYHFGFDGRPTWKPAESLVCDVFKQLNVLHQTTSCFIWHDIRDIAIHWEQNSHMQANATKRLHQFRKRSHFSRDAKRIYEKTYYSHASPVVSTVTRVVQSRPGYIAWLKSSLTEVGDDIRNISEKPDS